MDLTHPRPCAKNTVKREEPNTTWTAVLKGDPREDPRGVSSQREQKRECWPARREEAASAQESRPEGQRARTCAVCQQ